MAIEVVASLVGASVPQMVQVEVTGLTSGDLVSIRGATGLHTWPVRGGIDVVTTGSQLVRRDNLPAINAPIVYAATVGGVQYSADPITVPHASQSVVSTLGGEQLALEVGFTSSMSDELDMELNVHLSYPNGRPTPVAVSAPGGGESGAWAILTDTPAATFALRDAVRSSMPLILRTSGHLADFPPARIVQPRKVSRAQTGHGATRLWSLSWVEISDPLASIPVTAWVLGDFSAVWSAASAAAESERDYDFATINAFIQGLGGTFGDINRFPWDEGAA